MVLSSSTRSSPLVVKDSELMVLQVLRGSSSPWFSALENVLMVLSGCQPVLSGSPWFSAVLNGSQWFSMVLSSSQ